MLVIIKKCRLSCVYWFLLLRKLGVLLAFSKIKASFVRIFRKDCNILFLKIFSLKSANVLLIFLIPVNRDRKR